MLKKLRLATLISFVSLVAVSSTGCLQLLSCCLSCAFGGTGITKAGYDQETAEIKPGFTMTVKEMAEAADATRY